MQLTYHVQGTVGIEGTGIDAGFDWLAGEMASRATVTLGPGRTSGAAWAGGLAAALTRESFAAPAVQAGPLSWAGGPIAPQTSGGSAFQSPRCFLSFGLWGPFSGRGAVKKGSGKKTTPEIGTAHV